MSTRITTQTCNLPALNEQSSQVQDPWELIWCKPYIDATRLATAIEHDLQNTPTPDFRTRLLVRDACRAIKAFWGRKKFTNWIKVSPAGAKITAILQEKLGRIGYVNIQRRLVASIDATQLGQIFDLLGRRIHDRIEVNIAGSIPTLIQGLTARPTTNIDFVNNTPTEIRRQRSTVGEIKKTYGLALRPVQSHYLPANWEQRKSHLGDYGGLRVYLVNEYDIFVSKLSSQQEKHKEDLRVLADQLDKEKAKHLLSTDGKSFLDNPRLRSPIEVNWRFIYQEPLEPPTPQTESRGARLAKEITRKPDIPFPKKRKGRRMKYPPL